jgi:nucleotide-binding universal stress UspA family protein
MRETQRRGLERRPSTPEISNMGGNISGAIMFKHILIATDGSELARKGIDQGLALAKALGAKATAVTVTEPIAAMMVGEAAIALPLDDYDKAAAANAAKILASVTAAATKAGVACGALHVKDQYPAEGIVEAAKSQGCDLIVMTSHGRRGLSKLLLGSQTTRVLTLSEVPVLVCR